MNSTRSSKSGIVQGVLTVVLSALLPAVAYAQAGNSISGQVFGLERRPVPDVNVELLDDYSRTLQRTRTNQAGRYVFYGLRDGRFRVRVLPFGTIYEEQEQEVEIVNFRRGNGSGDTRLAGASNEQKDFTLRTRRDLDAAGATGTVFAQEVPPEAKKLYESAVANLSQKKESEAYESLKAALEVFPKYYAALELLGTEYVRKGYFDAARVLLALATEVNPRSYRAWYGSGYALNALARYPEADAAAEKAVSLDQNAFEAVLLAGSVKRHLKDYQNAEKLLRKARDLSNDTLPEVHWELALLYGNDLKRFGDAAKELKSFLKARPDTKDADKIKRLIEQFEAKATGG